MALVHMAMLELITVAQAKITHVHYIHLEVWGKWAEAHWVTVMFIIVIQRQGVCFYKELLSRGREGKW